MQRFFLRAGPHLACVVLLYNLSSTAFAQSAANREEILSGEIHIRPRHVKNATGVADEALQVDEMQTEFGARIASIVQAEFTQLDLNYDFTETNYNKETQPDDSYWQGNSNLTLGSNTTFYQIAANHSIRRVLNSPDLSPVLLSNSDSREIITVSPLVRTRLGDANTIALAYNYSEVTFDEDETNDSERSGVDLRFIRRLSPIRQVSLILESREIDYETSDTADYEYVSAAVRLEVEHRVFDYMVEFGTTKIKPEIGDSLSSPTIDLVLNSSIVGNRFSLFANRSVSDSSLGNGNSDFFSTEVSFDAALADRDQIERTASGLSWSYDQLCSRCALTSGIGIERVEYINANNNDSRQSFIDMSFAYEFSRSLSSRFSTRVSKTSFDPTSVRADTRTTISRAELLYAYNRYLDFALSFERDERDTDGADEFAVDAISITSTLGFD